jgi:hypothetical protein
MADRLVRWRDDEDGWHTGKLVPCAIHIADVWPVARCGIQPVVLVQESCDGKLTWVPFSKLESWPLRSEWENTSA